MYIQASALDEADGIKTSPVSTVVVNHLEKEIKDNLRILETSFGETTIEI